jgi:urease accessory protein
MMRTILITEIIGYASDSALGEKLHHLGHDGSIEYLTLDREDTLRHRLRAETDHATVCQVALPRDQHLADGAVLVLDQERAIVVRMLEETWLRCAPRDMGAALELGYFAGNLHWRVRFDNEHILIAQEGPRQRYIDRLTVFFDDGRAQEIIGAE